MGEGGDGAGFLLKTLQTVALASERCRKDLDGNITPQACVACAEHFAHSTCSERGRNDKGSHLRARNKVHR